MKNKVIITSLIILLLGIFIIYSKGNGVIKKVEYKNLINTIKENDYSVVYTGQMDKNKEYVFNEIKKDNDIKFYQMFATNKEINELLSTSNLKTNQDEVFILYSGDEVEQVIDETIDGERLNEIIRKVFFNEIPQSEIAYKVPSSSSEYIKLIKKDKYVVTVFGKKDCNHCNLYMPKINEIATEKEIDIYYLDKDTYDQDEYNKIMALGLKIPAKCTTKNEETDTTNSFAKPLTLITKNGKTVDCILGNQKTSDVLDLLKKYHIIKEK